VYEKSILYISISTIVIFVSLSLFSGNLQQLHQWASNSKWHIHGYRRNKKSSYKRNGLQ